MASHPPTATWGAQPRKSAQAGSSPWPPSMKQKSSGVRQRVAMVGESPTTPTTRDAEPGAVDGPAPEGEGVDAPRGGVDDVVVVVVPSRLVLLRAVVVVDAEEHRAGGLGGGTEVDRRLPAPGADLHEGGRRRRLGPGPARPRQRAAPSSSGMKPLAARARANRGSCGRSTVAVLSLSALNPGRLDGAEDGEARQDDTCDLADGGEGQDAQQDPSPDDADAHHHHQRDGGADEDRHRARGSGPPGWR